MEFFTKREQIAILSVVLIVMAALGIKIIGDRQGPVATGVKSISEIDLVETDQISMEDMRPAVIMVHISGQVYHPGIYELLEGDRLVDVVNLSGGLTKAADLDRINLARKLSDEDKLYIPSIGEETTYEVEVVGSTSGGNGKININSCSKADLESLPGIGEVIAERVLEYRKTNKFQTPEDIKKVSGIGDAKYEQIKDQISVR